MVEANHWVAFCGRGNSGCDQREDILAPTAPRAALCVHWRNVSLQWALADIAKEVKVAH